MKNAKTLFRDPGVQGGKIPPIHQRYLFVILYICLLTPQISRNEQN